MIVTIQLDTESPLSSSDLDLLHTLTGLNAPSQEPAPAPAAPPLAPAPAATPAKRTKKKAAAPAEPEPEPTPAAEPEPATGEPEQDSETQRAEAIALASSLLASGKREAVMEALSAAGASRVSEVAAAEIPAFLTALRSS